MQFTIDSRKRLVTVKFNGTVSASDMEQYLQRLEEDPEFDPTYSELVDLTDAQASDIDARAALQLAHNLDPYSPNARRAFAAPNTAIFGITRMYQNVRHDEGNMRSFHSMDEAKQWLGLEAEATRVPHSSRSEPSYPTPGGCGGPTR
jgi:hypothetical protein